MGCQGAHIGVSNISYMGKISPHLYIGTNIIFINHIYIYIEREIGMIYLMLGCEEVSHFGGDVILTHA